MSVDTVGVISADVKFSDVLDLVQRQIDSGAKSEYYRTDNDGEVGRIRFMDENDSRGLFYCVTHSSYEGTDYEDGRAHVSLILGAWGNSILLMRQIVGGFGGWVDDSDSDDEGFYRVDQVDGKNDPEYERSRARLNAVMDTLDSDIEFDKRYVMAKQIVKHFAEIAAAIAKAEPEQH